MCRILAGGAIVIKNFIRVQGSIELTRIDDSINENIAWYQAIVILIHLAEQVCEARFFVIHELQELQTSDESGEKNQ